MKLQIFVLTGIVLLILDSVYFTFAKTYFNGQIKRIQGLPIKLNIISAILCYLFLAFGIQYFIINENKSYTDAFFLGLTIYAVYELTNKALFMNWHWFTVLIDSLWGGVLFASTTYVVRNIQKYLV